MAVSNPSTHPDVMCSIFLNPVIRDNTKIVAAKGFFSLKVFSRHGSLLLNKVYFNII